MRKRIISLVTPFVIGSMALALGWFAHAAVPLSAQGIVVDGHAAFSSPAAPSAAAAPPGAFARLTYQGRLSNNSSGAPINTTVSILFKLYDSSGVLLWTSAPRSVTPTSGLFTVYLGDGTDPNLVNSLLVQSATIGVTVGGDAEMFPRQALNSVVGRSEYSAGVTGSSKANIGVNGDSNSYIGVNGASSSYIGVYGSGITGRGVVGSSVANDGVYGFSDTGNGVYGSSNAGFGVSGSSLSSAAVFGYSQSSTGVSGSSNTGYGVVGQTFDATHAALLAEAAGNSGIGLEIFNGGIKATGAGVGTNTFAFIHKSSPANIFFNNTYIDNALTNGDPNAMLFVTHVVNPTGVAINYFNKAFGVYYDSDPSEPFFSKWSIYVEDNSGFPTDTTFNVMVIKR